MSIGNADKGMLPIDEIKRRVQPFVEENLPLVLTQVIIETSTCSTFCYTWQPASQLGIEIGLDDQPADFFARS